MLANESMGNFRMCISLLSLTSASTLCLSPLQTLDVPTGADMYMAMESMGLTDQATCGLAEDMEATSGLWIFGLAGFLTRQRLSS